MQTFLVFDIGGTFIKYALMDEGYRILEQGKVPSPLDSLDSLLAALAGVGKQYAGRYAGVAVSMPGRIDTKNGIAHTGGSFRFIHDVPFAAALTERLGAAATIANDGKCAANAELLDGALADVDNGCVLVLGTGTGGGIVLGHKVYMGSTFAAGELSCLPNDFANLHRGLFGPGGGIHLVWAGDMSATGLLRRYAARKGLPEEGHGIDGFAFFAAYDAGEPDAKDALADFARSAAAGIYAVQAVLDLQRYAIGGGISARPEVTAVIGEALDHVYEAVPITPFSKPELVRCRYGNDANLLGALHFHLEK